ncbi:UDP-2,4-diacetamido-2,4,6-trideoxy-beta-L-altropyranose hydrolase [Sagittula sp. NFXS13]|uniref:UDP-2,4-diacetamido-2,4, 6-trideoxy-beta-L-altropyranose hydrolase n=1 Tax=Sagittula sp. NFXS13 TaxID=2819095 RepID=UPI0032DFA326
MSASPPSDDAPQIVIRADASRDIGTGHVMRCLTLAEQLRRTGYAVRFVSRDLPGHLGARIQAEGFKLTLLPAPTGAPFSPDGPAHAVWAGVPWQVDADQTRAVMEATSPAWLIVDHYAFDVRWQKATLTQGTRLMVWDDLADRTHACDLLLDQNLGRTADAYAGLVPTGCRILAGPQFAVLRPEFAAVRPQALEARKGRDLRRITVSMGGVDLPNATGQVLSVLAQTRAAHDLEIEVILGSRAPAIDAVRTQAEAMPQTVEVAVDVTDMAARMARADLAIGAVGGTTWERCTLGLPSLLLTIAENQHPAAQKIHDAGAAWLLGDISDPDWGAELARRLGASDRAARMRVMADTCARLYDGSGVARVLAALSGSPDIALNTEQQP